MIVIGAGMAGLIAANYFRKQNPTVIERNAALPDNHAALLRFRTDKVFRVAGLPATQVTVRKSIVWGADFMASCNPYLANKYSLKVTGKIEDRSIWRTETEKRFIAPPDLLPRLADGCDIKFGAEFFKREGDYLSMEGYHSRVISTMPMPVLMKILGWKDIPQFSYKPIWVFTGEIDDCNVNQTIYFPDHEVPYYRASIVGGKFILEFATDPGDTTGVLDQATEALDYFGIDISICAWSGFRKQEIGKMLPIDDTLRKDFMHWATSEYGIYSLGRFATWRPILLDDVVDDLAVIERMMSSKYSAMLLK